MIPAVIGHLIPVIPGRIKAGVPVGLLRVNPVAALPWRHLKTGAVKQIKLKLRPDHHPVRNPALLHILDRPQAHVLRILVKRLVLVLADGADITAHRKRRNLGKRINICRIRIGQKYHIAFFHRRKPVIRTVKADALRKRIFPKPFHGNRNVPPASVDIRHLKIDHADMVFFAQFFNFFTFHKCYALS